MSDDFSKVAGLEPMRSLEADLRRLTCPPAPAGLADAVMARIADLEVPQRNESLPDVAPQVAEPTGRKNMFALPALMSGGAVAIGLEILRVLAADSSVLSSWQARKLADMPYTDTASLILIASLLFFLLGLFADEAADGRETVS